METLCIVAEFDVPGNVCAGVFSGRVAGAVDSLDLHGGVERFGEGVIETHSGGTDRLLDVEQAGHDRERFAGVLCSAIGAKPNSV